MLVLIEVSVRCVLLASDCYHYNMITTAYLSITSLLIH